MFSKNKEIKILNSIKSKNFDEDTITYSDGIMVNDLWAIKLLEKIFINKGYLIINIYDNPDLYVYFEKENEGIRFLAYYETIKLDFKLFLRFLDLKVETRINIDKYNVDEEKAKEFLNAMRDIIIGVLTYINLLIHEEKTIIEENTTERKVILNNKKKKNKITTKKVKTIKNINITDTVIKKINLNSNTNSEKREYNRQIQSWTVRGYWRNYKSGKKVWIEPQTRKAKSSDSKIKIRKNYIVAENK